MSFRQRAERLHTEVPENGGGKQVALWKHYTGYESTQKQRQIERAIRKQKWRIAADEASGDSEQLKTDKTRLAMLRREYREFSKAAGAGKTPQTLANSGESGIMKATTGYARQEGFEPVIPERYKDDFSDFETLSLEPKEREMLTELHERTTATGFEYGQVRTNSGFSEVFTSGKNNSVSIPDDLKELDGLSLYHGHTNVTMFSAQDLRLLTQENVEKVTVVTSDGSVFSARIGSGWRPTLEEFNDAVDSIETATDRDLMEHEDFFSWSVQERNYMAIRERAYRIARYFEWTLEGGKI